MGTDTSSSRKTQAGAAEPPLGESDALAREGLRKFIRGSAKEFEVTTDEALAEFMRGQLPANGFGILQDFMPASAQRPRIGLGTGEIEHVQFGLAVVCP